jgi:hypothetical protein
LTNVPETFATDRAPLRIAISGLAGSRRPGGDAVLHPAHADPNNSREALLLKVVFTPQFAPFVSPHGRKSDECCSRCWRALRSTGHHGQ